MAEDEGSEGKSSGNVSIAVLLIVILVVGGIAAGLTYFYSTQSFNAKVVEKDATIVSLQEQAATLKAECEGGQTPEKPCPTTPVSNTGELDCTLCHDLKQHKEFHVPETIMKIDEAHGLRRRVCVDCHGPNGYDANGNFLGWSADEQMTNLDSIDFDPEVGENGKFILSNQIVHAIHKRRLDAGILKCEFCHVKPGSGEFVKPQVKTELGRVLYCQNEGCHDNEGGNYIAIHVELRPFKCTTCHTGDLVNVHKGGTSVLGKFQVVNGSNTHILH